MLGLNFLIKKLKNLDFYITRNSSVNVLQIWYASIVSICILYYTDGLKLLTLPCA